jgi:hypothetical protein
MFRDYLHDGVRPAPANSLPNSLVSTVWQVCGEEPDPGSHVQGLPPCLGPSPPANSLPNSLVSTVWQVLSEQSDSGPHVQGLPPFRGSSHSSQQSTKLLGKHRVASVIEQPDTKSNQLFDKDSLL